MKVARQLSLIALLTALGGVVHLLETLIPFPLPVPGGRWGFSNAIILIALPGGKLSDLLLLGTAKSVLGAFLGGRLLTPMFLMSIGGIVTAILVMWIMSKPGSPFGLTGISLAGAITNNAVQLLVAASLVVRSTALFLIFPYFLIFGSIAAMVNAVIAYSTLRKVGGSLWKEN